MLAQREGDVVVEVERPEQRAVLEEHAELLAQLEEVVVGERGDRLPGDDHVALVGVEQADDVLDAHRLAGARWAEDHRHLALGDPEVEPAQHAVGAEGLVHVDELDRVGGVAGRGWSRVWYWKSSASASFAVSRSPSPPFAGVSLAR